MGCGRYYWLGTCVVDICLLGSWALFSMLLVRLPNLMDAHVFSIISWNEMTALKLSLTIHALWRMEIQCIIFTFPNPINVITRNLPQKILTSIHLYSVILSFKPQTPRPSPDLGYREPRQNSLSIESNQSQSRDSCPPFPPFSLCPGKESLSAVRYRPKSARR